MVKASLIRRLEAAEARISSSARQGLAFLHALIEVEGTGQYGDADVIAVDVGSFSLHGRTRVERRPGETVADLEARANPRGCWRTAPLPVFAHGAGYAERAEVLWMALNNRHGRRAQW